MDYPHLRSWYLARLRKNIVGKQHARSLTPSAQIRADRQALENLVSGSTRTTIPINRDLAKSRSCRSVAILAGSTGTALSAAAFFLLHVGAHSSHSIPQGIIWILSTLPLLCSLFIVTRFSEDRISQLDSVIRSMFDIAPELQMDTAGESVSRLYHDIKKLMVAFHQSVEREHAIADYALDFFFALDAEGKIVAASPASFDFCGFDQTELLHRDFAELCNEGDAPRAKSFLKAMASATEPVPFECQWKRRNNDIMDVRVTAEYSPSEAAFFCVANDVTRDKEIERIRKEFVSMIGHDIKTPLTSVSCTLELLELSDSTLSAQSLEMIDLMKRNLSYLLDLIQDLLDLSKMQAGKLSLDQETVSLEDIFQTAKNSLSGSAATRNINVQIEDSSPDVVADKKRILQVVTNLLSNAIKYSPDNANIDISTQLGTDHVTIRVRDYGVGVAADAQKLIFERFKQANAERDAAKGGTGLGLAICKYIVELHGGQIGVESEEGKGSTFWFSLPAQPVAQL